MFALVIVTKSYARSGNEFNFIIGLRVMDYTSARGFDHHAARQKATAYQFFLGKPAFVATQALPLVVIADHDALITRKKNGVSDANRATIAHVVHSTLQATETCIHRAHRLSSLTDSTPHHMDLERTGTLFTAGK